LAWQRGNNAAIAKKKVEAGKTKSRASSGEFDFRARLKRRSLDTGLARGNSAPGPGDFFDTPFKRGVRARIVAGAFACLLL
jgi:hypothetical protein